MSDEPRKGSKRLIIWAVFVVAAMIAAVAYDITRSVKLPEASAITSMQAVLIDGDGAEQVFSVPASHWTNVLDSLKPYERDYHPAKWSLLGFVTIDQNGSELAIILFNTKPGGFAVSRWFGREYYRGGNSEKLRAALLKAHKASTATPQPKSAD